MFELSSELQDQLVKLSELLPIVIIGFFMGIASVFAEPEDERAKKPKTTPRQIIGNIFTSMVLCVAVYGGLGFFESVDYLVRVGCACAVSFFGVDKIIDIFLRFKHAKDGKPH